MRRIIRVLAVAPLLLTAVALGSYSARTAAQTAAGVRVVATEPKVGDNAVAPTVNQLKITFSEPMNPNEYSLWQIENRDLPEWGGRPVLSADGRTFTIPITLRPGRQYGMTVNAPGHMKFVSAAGKLAERFDITFSTANAAGPADPGGAAAPAPGGTTPVEIPAGFRIATPTDGSEVRDKVPVEISTGAVPDGHYVTFHVDKRFMLGLAPDREKPMMRFEWDTKDKLPMLKTDAGIEQAAAPKDGQHTIRAELRDAGGALVQVHEINVNLKNAIDTQVFANGMKLQYQFEPNKDLEYRQIFTCEVKSNSPAAAGAGAGASGGYPGSSSYPGMSGYPGSSGSSETSGGPGYPGSPGAPGGGTTQAARTKHRGEVFPQILFEEKAETGGYALSARFGRAKLNDENLAGRDLAERFGLTNLVRFELDPSGKMSITGRSGKPLFDAVNVLLPFPANPVRIGESWDGPMILPEVLKGNNAVTQAKHYVEGVEWQGGQETLRIRSDYMVRNLKGIQPSRYLFLATNMATVTPDASMEVRGRRVTYFAYRLGRVMRVSEHKEIHLVIPPAPVASAGGFPGTSGGYPGGSGGYPGAPGGGTASAQKVIYDVTVDETTDFVPPEEEN